MSEDGRGVSNSAPVLVVSHDVVGARMAGPGIRYWELSRVLGKCLEVVLAAPQDTVFDPPEGVRPWQYTFGEWESLAPAVTEAKAILLSGDVLAWFPELEDSQVPLIVDGYDPHTLETLAIFAGRPEQQRRHQERETILQRQCAVGDFFICASERQRDWWLGLLEATGRVNVRTYEDDASLRSLVDIVPYGLPSRPPRHTKQVLKGVESGIGLDDKVVLWGGGLWQWLDPLTAVRAMDLIQEVRSDVRLVFPGTEHPSPAVPKMTMYSETIRLAKELGLDRTCVFFGDWVPYCDWPNYLLESDIGLSLHFDTVESRLAYRSRVLDYIWAGLPMVVTRGDAISEEIVRFRLGEVIHHRDEEALATAILQLLDRVVSDDIVSCFQKARAEMTWDKAATPLAAFCRCPRRAPDKGFRAEHSFSFDASETQHEAELQALRRAIADQETEVDRLREKVAGYERGRFIRFMRWLHGLLT